MELHQSRFFSWCRQGCKCRAVIAPGGVFDNGGVNGVMYGVGSGLGGPRASGMEITGDVNMATAASPLRSR